MSSVFARRGEGSRGAGSHEARGHPLGFLRQGPVKTSPDHRVRQFIELIICTHPLLQ